MNKLYKNFPENLQQNIVNINWNDITEIRLRINAPVIVNTTKGEVILGKIIVDEKLLATVFNNITEYSAYAYENSIKRGFLTLEGGHRVGLGGQVDVIDNKICNIRNITYLNFRICHHIKDCGVNIEKEIIVGQTINNTLIVAPPGLGKTTLLRDLIRIVSNKLLGQSICVIDERNEISGSYRGVPSIDLGMRTDVICGCKKDEGILMAIRAMSPNVIAVDEIGSSKDNDSLKMASVSGVKIIATIHGKSKEDALFKLGQANLFEKYIIIKKIGDYVCL